MSNKKIAMLSDHPDSLNPRIWRTAKTLGELGYDVTLFCQRLSGQNGYDYKENVHIKRVFNYKLGTSVLIDKYLTAHFQLREALLKESPFDIFHCHDPETWPIGFLIAKEQNAKWIADSHEYFPDYIEKKYYQNDLNKYNTAIQLSRNRGEYIRYADGFITVSKETRQALNSDYKLTCPSIVLYNTRHENDVIHIDKLSLRRELGLKSNLKYMIFGGNITPERGVETLIKLIQFMPQRYKLIIIGDGLTDLEVTKANETSEKIIYLGRQDYNKLIKYVHACDAYLYFPYYCEKTMMLNYKYTIPNKIFDAIFSKIPFFTYDGFAFSEMVRNFNIGSVYPTDLGLEKISIDIVSKLEESYFKEENFDLAQSYYSWEKQKDKLKNLYTELC